MDLLSKLPPDMIDHVLEYCNPYRDYFRQHVSSDIWKDSWYRFYNQIDDSNLRVVIYYLMTTWGFFKDPMVIPSSKQEDVSTYFPTDVKYDILPCDEQWDDSYQDIIVFLRPINDDVPTILFYGKILHYRKSRCDYTPDYELPFFVSYHDTTAGIMLYKYLNSHGWGPAQYLDTGMHSYLYPDMAT